MEGEKSEGEKLHVGEALSFSFWVENGEESIKSRSVRVTGEKDLDVRIIVFPFFGAPIQENEVFGVKEGGVQIIVRLVVLPGTKPQKIEEVRVELRTSPRDRGGCEKILDCEKIVENLTIPESIFIDQRRRKIDQEEKKVSFFERIENKGLVAQRVTLSMSCPFPFSESESFISIGDNKISPKEWILIEAKGFEYPVTEVFPIGTVADPECPLKFERKK